MAWRRTRDGQTHGASELSGGRRAGARRAGSGSARCEPAARARLQPEHGTGARPGAFVGRADARRSAGAHARDEVADAVDTRGALSQRFGRVPCTSGSRVAARAAPRAGGRRRDHVRDAQRVRRGAPRRWRTHSQLCDLRPGARHRRPVVTYGRPMAIRVGINGFGRIGRQVLRAARQSGVKGIDFVAVNDLTDTKTLAHLFKYDSVHREYEGDVTAGASSITVDGDEIRILAEKDPGKLPWKELGVDIVLESTGRFTEK